MSRVGERRWELGEGDRHLGKPELFLKRFGGCIGHELTILGKSVGFLGARETESPISTVPRIPSESNLHGAPPEGQEPLRPRKRRPLAVNSLRVRDVHWHEVASVVKLAIMPNFNCEFCWGNHGVACVEFFCIRCVNNFQSEMSNFPLRVIHKISPVFAWRVASVRDQ